MPLLQRLADGFSDVTREWEGQTVVCIASGPSLTRAQVEFVRGKARVIAINNAYLWAPWADVLYFADERWLSRFGHAERPEFKAFAGEKVTIEESGKTPGDPRFHLLRNDDMRAGTPEGLSSAPDGLRTGRHSGYQAINLAVLGGAKRILLLGYDMRFIDGKQHWFGSHPIKNHESEFSGYAKRYRSTVEPLKTLGVEVINCTPGSAIDAFLKLDLCRALTA